MVAGNPSSVIRNAGKLVVGPDTVTLPGSDGNYGGTAIGLITGAVLTPLGVGRRIENEGLGQATDILAPNNRYVFSCFLRGADDDVKTLLLRGNRAEGSKSAHGVLTFPGSRTPGQSIIDYANVVLLFVPDNRIDHDALIMYRAIPLWDENAEVAYQKGEEYGIPLGFELLLNGASTPHTHQIGRLVDLSLS